MADTEVRVCEECGASIYPEHIGAQKAGFWGGKLFCVHCFGRRQHAQVTISPIDVRPQAPTLAAPAHRPAPMPTVLLEEGLDEDAPHIAGPTTVPPVGEAATAPTEGEEISLAQFARPAIKPFLATGATAPGESPQHKHKRHLHHSDKGAIRCRIFHAKLNDGALHFMQDQINDWIDQNPEVEIKHVNTDVGIVEGKSSEPHLIITLFY